MEKEENSEIMKQGNTYEEESTNKEEQRVSKNLGNTLNKQILILGGLILIVLLIIIFVVSICISFGKEKKEEETIPEWMTEEYTESVFSYTEEEKAELRLAGYTGKDIEEFEFLEKDVSDLVKEAEKERQELRSEEHTSELQSPWN